MTFGHLEKTLHLFQTGDMCYKSYYLSMVGTLIKMQIKKDVK